MPPVFLALGSNLGNRMAHLQAAVDALAGARNVQVDAVSPVYETEAHTLHAADTQPSYLNAVVEGRTSLSPEQLLDLAKSLETARGRDLGADRWAPRPLDVDLLMVGTCTRQSSRLTLPHPRLGDRRFVLRPWADLAPNLVVPSPFDESVSALLDRCTDAGALVRTPHELTVPSAR
jgi:2-amino-4-hydroxy-6-hydroxymethyldihydropteridine diphosphokinase